MSNPKWIRKLSSEGIDRRRTFLDNFTDEELEKLVATVFVRVLHIHNRVDDPQKTKNQIKGLYSFKEFFGLLCLWLIDEYDVSQKSFELVMASIDEFHKKLANLPMPTKKLTNDLSTPTEKSKLACPRELKLFNPHVADGVFLTKHAWERFYDRFSFITRVQKNQLTINRLLSHLKKSFARAQPVKLSKKAEVLRIINNNFKRAQYLYDSSLNLRFVIINNTLATVEIAECK